MSYEKFVSSNKLFTHTVFLLPFLSLSFGLKIMIDPRTSSVLTHIVNTSRGVSTPVGSSTHRSACNWSPRVCGESASGKNKKNLLHRVFDKYSKCQGCA